MKVSKTFLANSVNMQVFIDKGIWIGRATCPEKGVVIDEIDHRLWCPCHLAIVCVRLVVRGHSQNVRLVTNHTNIIFLACNGLDVLIHIIMELF